jgi:hypothetical protein
MRIPWTPAARRTVPTLPRTLAIAIVVALVLVVLPTMPGQAVQVPQTLAHRAPATAGPVVPGFPIDHLGVLWDDSAAAEHADEHASHGAVRFRHDGAWGPWIPLAKEGTSQEGQWASGLVPGAGAEAFQVHGIPADAESPRTVALNTTDGPLRATGVRFSGAAAIDNCRSRAEWGADESLRMREGPDFFDAQVMTLHHTATGNNDTDPAATVRAIYQYHTVDLGYRDIGYHYLISEDGTVFEGRWSGQLGATWQEDTYSQACAEGGTGADFAHESDQPGAQVARGAHAGGWNTGNLGVGLIGSFSERGRYRGTPTPAAVASAEGVLAEFSQRHGIDPQGTIAYSNPENSATVAAISGHRDYNATECPGDNLYLQLPQIRSNVAALVDTGEPTLQVTITTPSAGERVQGTVQAAATTSGAASQVEFFVDEESLGTDTDGADGWSFDWDTTGTADGTHTLAVTAADASGITAQDSITVTVANDGAPGGDTMHVSDLDGAATNEGATWTALTTIAVVDNTGQAVAGATVAGTWSSGGAPQCTTDAAGRCTVALPDIAKRNGTVGFSVSDVVGPLPYDPAANTDPDGDSNGTTITVSKS